MARVRAVGRFIVCNVVTYFSNYPGCTCEFRRNGQSDDITPFNFGMKAHNTTTSNPQILEIFGEFFERNLTDYSVRRIRIEGWRNFAGSSAGYKEQKGRFFEAIDPAGLHQSRCQLTESLVFADWVKIFWPIFGTHTNPNNYPQTPSLSSSQPSVRHTRRRLEKAVKLAIVCAFGAELSYCMKKTLTVFLDILRAVKTTNSPGCFALLGRLRQATSRARKRGFIKSHLLRPVVSGVLSKKPESRFPHLSLIMLSEIPAPKTPNQAIARAPLDRLFVLGEYLNSFSSATHSASSSSPQPHIVAAPMPMLRSCVRRPGRPASHYGMLSPPAVALYVATPSFRAHIAPLYLIYSNIIIFQNYLMCALIDFDYFNRYNCYNFG
ncbi:hypothetical protein R3P38DRAFT_2816396 [Favolaschia claudopus]|uniref:Uncharacterized protein n=1 Tax=Favolaschia claudopus TaxID=2862362 RepID=A0AAV9YZF0_9AGAR